MNSKRTVLTVAIVAAALLVIAGVAQSESAPPPRSVASAHAVTHISAFKRSFHPTRKQARQRRVLKRILKRAPRGSIAATANVAQSRPSPIAGGTGDVWITPADGGAVCTYITDPVDGYASSCATAADIAAGAAVTMLGGGSRGPLTASAIVAVVVPDEADTPSVIYPAGDRASIVVHSNAAAALVPLGSTVDSGGLLVLVPKAPAPKCAPPKPGESGKRCDL